MRVLSEQERAKLRAIVEQLDRAMKRDETMKTRADRREQEQLVSVERRTGGDRRKQAK